MKQQSFASLKAKPFLCRQKVKEKKSTCVVIILLNQIEDFTSATINNATKTHLSLKYRKIELTVTLDLIAS